MTLSRTARLNGSAASPNATLTTGVAVPEQLQQPCRRRPAPSGQLAQLLQNPPRQPARDLGEPRPATAPGEMHVRRANVTLQRTSSSSDEPSAGIGRIADATNQSNTIRDRSIDPPERLKVHVRTTAIDHSSDADNEDWDYDMYLVQDPRRAQVLEEALSKVLDPAVQPLPLTQHMSLGEIARNAGVSVAGLESAIKDFLAQFSEDRENSPSWSFTRNIEAFTDILYNLHVLSSRRPLAAPWLEHMQGFDTFVAHFCPQASRKAQSGLIKGVQGFIHRYHPRMLLKDKDLKELRDDGINATGAVYSRHGSWVKLPAAWVDRRVIDEALALAQTGIPEGGGLFVHGTGSAAMDGIAKHQAISSAGLALRQGDKVKTGEYVSYIGRDGQTSTTGGSHGLGNVYSSYGGLSYEFYTMQRWFDEAPVTFGISQNKQYEFNKAMNIKRSYNSTGEGVLLGPNVPLENVVAISAPKEHEARIREWIVDHCPHAQFVSYEAAALLEHRNMFGLLS